MEQGLREDDFHGGVRWAMTAAADRRGNLMRERSGHVFSFGSVCGLIVYIMVAF
jgi:hypothetical protein